MKQIDLTRNSLLLKAVALVALLGLSGCMIPYPDHETCEGTEVKQSSLQWLHTGDTTRAQVLTKLGEPNVDFVNQRTIAYTWAGQSGGVFFLAPKGSGPIPIASRRALMIRFSADDKIADFSVIERPTKTVPYSVHNRSYDAVYDDWRRTMEAWQARRSRAGESAK